MNWMKYLPVYFLISALAIIPSVYSLVRYGLSLSIEFTGGSRITLAAPATASAQIISALDKYSSSVETSDQNKITFKTREISQEEVQKLIPQYSLEDFERIGPSLGKETIRKTINALLISSFLLLLYISSAFKQFKYGLCAILAMLHDSIILIGSFSLLGHFYGVEVDLLFVTAVLTILSFSVHDTIVVYDRIRELSHKEKGIDFVSLVNQAVGETMIRSLNNSLTIIFMLLAMFLIGGETTKFFSLALLIGTVTGTYSSTFTAAPLLVLWHKIANRKR